MASLKRLALGAALLAMSTDAAPLRGAGQEDANAVLARVDEVLDKEMDILGAEVRAEEGAADGRFAGADEDKFKGLSKDDLEEAIIGMLAVSLDMEQNRIRYNDAAWTGGKIASYGGAAAGAKAGAATGAAVGAMFGGIGAGPGAAVGAIAGWFGGGAMVEYVDITRADFFSGYSKYCTTRTATGAAYNTAQTVYAAQHGGGKPFTGCKTMDGNDMCVQALLSQADALSKTQNSDTVKAIDTLDKATSITDAVCASAATALFGGFGESGTCESFKEK